MKIANRAGWSCVCGLWRECLCFVIAMLGPAMAVRAQSCEGQWLPGEGLPGLNGEVFALLEWDSKPGIENPRLVAGGKFTIAGTSIVSNIAVWDGETWASLGGGVDGNVYALAQSMEGNLLVGGTFANAGGTAARSIARWNGVEWTPIGAGFTGDFFTGVRSLLVLADGGLLAGGDFAKSGSTVVNGIARWDGNQWVPLGAGVSKPGSFQAKVSALAVQADGEIIAGGDFQSAGGTAIAGIASWDGANWKSLGAGLGQAGGFLRVNALQKDSMGDLIVGGYFDTAGGIAAKYIAKWNGSSWAAFAKNPGAEIASLAIDTSGVLYAGGSLGTYRGIARWNGTSWISISTGISFDSTPFVGAICARENGRVVAGGTFYSMGSASAFSVAAWDGMQWESLGTGLNSRANTIAGTPDGGLVLGGVFTAAGGVACNNVAYWNGLRWDSMDGGVVQNGQFAPNVSDLHVRANGDVVAVGLFNRASNGPVSNIASWNGKKWNPLTPGFWSYFGGANVVTSAPNGNLIATGALEVPGTGMVKIAQWNESTWTPVGSSASFGGPIACLADGTIVACEGLKGLAKWDGLGWATIPGVRNNYVLSMCVLPNGEIVIGGSFTSVNGNGMEGIASWHGAWRSAGAEVSGTVRDLKALPNGDVLAAGAMTGVARRRGSTWTALGTGFNGRVNTVDALASGEVVVAGDFTTVGGKVSAYWARWSDRPKPWVAFSPAGETRIAGETVELVASPANGFESVHFQWRRNGSNVQNGSAGSDAGVISGASGSFRSPTKTEETRLVITNIQHSDAGVYDVVFWNACGEASSKGADVRVKINQSDLNADGVVNDADFGIFVHQYDLMLCDDAEMIDGCSADFDANGVVDDGDFVLFVPQYNRMIG